MKGMSHFDFSIVKNPMVFKQNAMPAHSDHIAFETKEEAENGVSGFRYSLNGLWKFCYSRTPKTAPSGFENPEYDCSRWEDIRVPSPVQTEGYGKPGYQNVAYPWDGHEEIDPGDIPESFNPVMCYVKEFSVPETFPGKPLYVSFQGVESGYALWLNGQYVGYSEDTFTPTDFDLTPFVKAGSNRLAVEVFRWTAGAWLEDQDFFRLSGIFRDVYLYTVPSVHLYDLRIRAVPDEDLKNAELEITWNLQSAGTEPAGGIGSGKSAGSGKAGIRYTLRRGEKAVLTGEALASDGRDILFGADTTLTAEQMKEAASGHTGTFGDPEAVHPLPLRQVVTRDRVSSPALWSAEDPQLYDLDIEVLDENGALDEFVTEKVGFRRFEMRNGIMCLNGKRIVFNGVNRHEFFADSGRTPDPEKVRQDVITMKRANINAVRTCHYPDASIIYRLCDEMGLYMIAENNMETHGVWVASEIGHKGEDYCVPGNRPEYLELVLDRVNSCYQRDKNHPAILIWSDGNESYSGRDVQEMTNKFHALDPDRLVHYEGIAHDPRTPQVSDMYSQMYTPAEKIPEFLEQHGDRPFILCEYTHSMGNSNGGMFRYRDLAEKEPRFQGGFIWDFVDQAFTVKNRFGEWYQAYGGDFDERPTDYEFSGNGIVDSLRRPYGKIQEVRFLYQTIRADVDAAAGKVTVWNKNNFVNTDAFDCLVTLEQEGRLIESRALPVSVEPLLKKTFELPVRVPDAAGEYVVTVSFRLKEDTAWAERGYEVAFGQGAVLVKETEKAASQSAAEKSDRGSACGREFLTAQSAATAAAPAEIPGIPVLAFGALSGIAPVSPLTVVHGMEDVGVYGAHFHVLFSYKLCRLVSYVYGGREMIRKMPSPSFWRAPTSNDEGNFMAARQGIWKLASEYGDPRLLNVEDAYHGRSQAECRMPLPEIHEAEGSFSIAWIHILPTVPESKVKVIYRVTPDGAVECRMEYVPVKGLPPMPEFGMKFGFDADFDTVSWYGNGPEETYSDRDCGGRLGVYSREVKDMVEPYLVPQETGNRTGVRWAKVTDRRGRGLLFAAAGGSIDDAPVTAPDGAAVMNFSALPYSPEQLEEARHAYELPRHCITIVRCSLQQQGVAGDDSWGSRTLPQFQADSGKKMSFSVRMKGI